MGWGEGGRRGARFRVEDPFGPPFVWMLFEDGGFYSIDPLRAPPHSSTSTLSLSLFPQPPSSHYPSRPLQTKCMGASGRRADGRADFDR